MVVYITLCNRMAVFIADLDTPSSYHQIMHELKSAQLSIFFSLEF